MTDIVCNYCGTALADLPDVEVGDELHCDDCDVTYSIEGPPETAIKKWVVCADCDEPIKASVVLRSDDAPDANEDDVVEVPFIGIEGIVSGDTVVCPHCDETFAADLHDGITTEEVKPDYDYLRTVPQERGS